MTKICDFCSLFITVVAGRVGLNKNYEGLLTKGLLIIRTRVLKPQTFQPPSHANLEVLKNKPRKTWRLGPQIWRVKKYASNKNNNDRLFVSRYSLPN